MVATITARHFADLATATGLAGPFAELERLLGADFGTDGDRYAHREVIASLLAPWFAERDLADIGRQLDGTSVLWSRYRRFTDLVGELTRDGGLARDGDPARSGDPARDGDLAGHPLIREIDQPGVGRVLAPGSPLVREDRPDPEPAPLLGADTAAVLAGLLGLSAQDISALADRGVAGCGGAGGSPVTRPSP
jgi:2-methylfumaryl-CoA isomerase